MEEADGQGRDGEAVRLAEKDKNCCLCCVNLKSSKGRTRQKKLYGLNYAAEKLKLQECMVELCKEKFT